MSDLRLTIEDMIACIWFPSLMSFMCRFIQARWKNQIYSNTHMRIKSGKNMHNFFAPTVLRFFFFSIRIPFMAQSLKFIPDQNKHKPRESFRSFIKHIDAILSYSKSICRIWMRDVWRMWQIVRCKRIQCILYICVWEFVLILLSIEPLSMWNDINNMIECFNVDD